MRRRLAVAWVCLAAVATVPAEETTADWLKRILDPTTIGVAPYPGSTLNKKVSVDTIRYDKDAPPTKRTAIYTAPLDQLDAIATHFETTLGTKPTTADTDSKGVKHWTFAITGAPGQPAKLRGLTVVIERSPWVDGMAQITMTWVPPA